MWSEHLLCHPDTLSNHFVKFERVDHDMSHYATLRILHIFDIDLTSKSYEWYEACIVIYTPCADMVPNMNTLHQILQEKFPFQLLKLISSMFDLDLWF